MKTQLTKEQSQHLIDLGVPEVYASVLVQPKHIGGQVVMPDRRFTLADILEILPKAILNSSIEMEWHKIPQKWKVCYAWMSETLIFNEELIDSLYELCVWCLKQKYLKFE